jgi:pseudouridine-5'-phosphate glycosidase/pseudouridine kinase
MVQVFGSAAIDITTRPSIPLQPRTTTPGSILLTPGGVGRNIAEATQNLLPPGSVQLVSTIGTSTEGIDGFGKVLKLEMESSGMRVDGLVEMSGRTAGCTLSLGMEGDLNDGVADMGIIEGLTPNLVCPLTTEMDEADVIGGTSDSEW